MMDVQPTIVQRLDDPEGYLERARAAVKLAHERKIPVIFVVLGFRKGMPEIGRDNKIFRATKERAGSAMVEPAPAIEPAQGDIVVIKRRVSAFTGSDLEVLLRAQAIKRLVLCGIATSGVVLSTLRQAADMDYDLTVLCDLCIDFDEEVHRVLVERVFPRQADILTLADWAATS
jgi:nicotinamidase-related amidase